jgi:hypothetical protein
MNTIIMWKTCIAVFLMASIPSEDKMYRTSATDEIHAALHFARKVECIKYILQEKRTL